MFDHSMLQSTFINAKFIDVLYASLLAFILGSVIAMTYIRSFSGLSYSKTFMQSLVLAPLLTAIAMQAIGDSVAHGIGMIGAFSILRFRTNIKDTRDMMFMFAALSMGLGCGVYAYSIVIIGLVFFCTTVIVLYRVPFAATSDFDAILRLQVDNAPENLVAVDKVLNQSSRKFSLVSLREMSQGARVDLSYQLKLQNKTSQNIIVSELGKIQSLKDVQIFMQDNTYEA